MRILVTGASGLIGRELTASLTDRGHEVVALLHRARTLRRNDGSPIAPERLTTLAGDVSHPALGLVPAQHADLAASLDLVVHAAALTAFNLAADQYERVNVGGMRNVLGLAASRADRPVPVLAVSTAYVCGERSGPIAELAADPAAPFANDYERSKARAEALAQAAIAAGHPVAIARPSIVVGAWSDGAIGEFGNIYQLIRLVAEGRVRVLPASPDATLDLVPIDHVVAGLLDLAEGMERARGRIVHLVSGRPVPVTMLATLAEHFPDLNPPRFLPLDRFDPTLLAPLERRLNLSVTDLFASYLKRDPRFADDNLRALTGRTCPPTDQPYIRRLIDYALASGFIISPTAQRASG